MKAEINGLGARSKEFTKSEKEWTAVKEALANAKDRDGNELDMSTVGISTGIFVPTTSVEDNDWLFKADKVALEHAKTLNLPKKNMTSIYYEGTVSLISDEKVNKCLEIGVFEGRQ